MTFSVKDIMERYGVGSGTVVGWIRAGELVAINVARRMGGKKARWRVTEAALKSFEALRTPTVPQPKANRRKRGGDIIEYYK